MLTFLTLFFTSFVNPIVSLVLLNDRITLFLGISLLNILITFLIISIIVPLISHSSLSIAQGWKSGGDKK